MKKVHWIRKIRKGLGGCFPPTGLKLMNMTVELLPRELTIEMFPNIFVDLDLSDSTMRSSFWRGRRFEKPTGQVLESWCSDAEKFFDIGANYGFFSYWMTSFSKDLEIYSFEPNPVTFRRIDTVVRTNNLLRVHPQNIGLSDQAALLPLRIGKSDSGHTTFGAHPDLDQIIENIPLEAFDKWLQNAKLDIPKKPVWVAKIDVEGFELNTLKGMAQSLKAQVFKGICIELNDFTLKFCHTSPAEVVKFLYDHGYQRSPAIPSQIQEDLGNGFFEPL